VRVKPIFKTMGRADLIRMMPRTVRRPSRASRSARNCAAAQQCRKLGISTAQETGRAREKNDNAINGLRKIAVEKTALSARAILFEEAASDATI